MSHSPNPLNGSALDQDSADMEIAQGFDDLDLEIASGPQETALPVPDELSIDDFQFVSDTPASKTLKSTHDEWYTKVLGQELGPFPFEQLIEMVIDGEVSPDDKLRQGKDHPWIIAGEIEGLFPEQTDEPEAETPAPAAVRDDSEDDDFELGVHLDEETLPVKPGAGPVGFQAVGGEINRASHPRSTRPAPKQRQFEPQAPVYRVISSNPVAKAETTTPPAPAAEPVAPPQPQLTAEEKAALRKQEIAAKLNSWLDDKVETPDPPAVEPETEPQAPAANPYAAPAGGYQQPAASPAGDPGAYGGYQPTQPAYTPPTPPKLKKRSSSGGGNPLAGLGSLFKGMPAPSVALDPKALGVIGAIAVVFVLMYLPGLFGGTNDGAIFNRYKEIYTQIEQARKTNPAQIKSFQAAATAEVEQAVADLEKAGAGSNKPAKQQLYWAGKNCLLKILKASSPEPSSFDDRFHKHMTTAANLLDETYNAPPPPPEKEE